MEKSLSAHNQADADTQKSPHNDLYGGVSNQLPQAFFGKRLALKRFIDHQVEDSRLDADRAAHAGGIVHDDGGKHEGDGEGHRIDASYAPGKSCQGSEKGGMRAWHAAG